MKLEVELPGLGDLLTGWLHKPLTTPIEHGDGSDSAAVPGHDPPRVPAPGSVLESVIDSMVESVDSILSSVPNPVPSAGQLRQARGRGVAHLSRATHRARRPLLAGIGTADLIAEQLRRHLTLRNAPSQDASTAHHQTQLDRARPESDGAPTSMFWPAAG
jgi:hypothetical protein